MTPERRQVIELLAELSELNPENADGAMDDSVRIPGARRASRIGL
jgi:hypothetical protein